MPVATGLVQIPPTPTEPAPGRRPIAAPGVYLATWYAPDGTVLDLNPPWGSTAWHSLKANAGLGVVPVDHITTNNPAGGVVVEATRPRERTILWPLRMRSNDHLELLETLRFVSEKFTQTRELGAGTLRITRPDGTAREILAHYSSGLEGDPDEGVWLRVTAVVNLLCPDPFWRSIDTVVQEYKQATQPDYLDPYMTVASGRVFGDTTIPNNGDRAVWPNWTIRGPMTSLVATNNTRGESFTVTHTLLAGETLTITGRPIQVRGDADENLISALGLTAGGGKPWRVDRRTVSDVTFALTGGEADTTPTSDDGTRVRLSYSLDHETA